MRLSVAQIIESIAGQPAIDYDDFFKRVHKILPSAAELHISDITNGQFVGRNELFGFCFRLSNINTSWLNVSKEKAVTEEEIKQYFRKESLERRDLVCFHFRMYKWAVADEFHDIDKLPKKVDLDLEAIKASSCSKFKVNTAVDQGGRYAISVTFFDLTYIATKLGVVHRIKEIGIDILIGKLYRPGQKNVEIENCRRPTSSLSALERIIQFSHGHHNTGWCTGDDEVMSKLSISSTEEWPQLMISLIRYLSFENSGAAYSSQRIGDKIESIQRRSASEIKALFNKLGGRLDFYEHSTNSEVDLLLALAQEETESVVESEPVNPTEEEERLFYAYMDNKIVITE